MMITTGLRAISKFLEEIQTGFDPNAIYRGHADHTWAVRASAFRPGGSGITNKSRLRRWESVASRFASPRPQSDFEWLVLAQHYGIPTPLLDWTTNPLVALFFACERTRHRSDGCVVRFNAASFTSYTLPRSIDVFKADRTKPGLLDAAAMNARTMAQDSAMSIHTKEMPDLTPDEGNLFLIPYHEQYWIQQALRTFGVTAERLYSDLAVAARRFKDELFISGYKDEI